MSEHMSMKDRIDYRHYRAARTIDGLHDDRLQPITPAWSDLAYDFVARIPWWLILWTAVTWIVSRDVALHGWGC